MGGGIKWKVERNKQTGGRSEKVLGEGGLKGKVCVCVCVCV